MRIVSFNSIVAFSNSSVPTSSFRKSHLLEEASPCGSAYVVSAGVIVGKPRRQAIPYGGGEQGLLEQGVSREKRAGGADKRASVGRVGGEKQVGFRTGVRASRKTPPRRTSLQHVEKKLH